VAIAVDEDAHVVAVSVDPDDNPSPATFSSAVDLPHTFAPCNPHGLVFGDFILGFMARGGAERSGTNSGGGRRRGPSGSSIGCAVALFLAGSPSRPAG